MSGEKLHTVYLGLGSNLGDREALLRRAVELLDERVGRVVRQSSLMETQPWGFQSAHPFLNAAVCCHTQLAPREVLRQTQWIERELGKRPQHATRRAARADTGGEGTSPGTCEYFDRPIDIDILLYDDLHVDEPGLRIPHPLMHERDFVMLPLSEILL